MNGQMCDCIVQIDGSARSLGASISGTLIVNSIPNMYCDMTCLYVAFSFLFFLPFRFMSSKGMDSTMIDRETMCMHQ